MLAFKQRTERKRFDAEDGVSVPGALRSRLRMLWSFMPALPGGFWLLPPASLGVLLVLMHPAARDFWLLALFVRQLLAYVFFIKVNDSGSNLWKRLYEHPAQMLVGSFMLLIILGGSILSLPACSASGRSIGANGLFTRPARVRHRSDGGGCGDGVQLAASRISSDSVWRLNRDHVLSLRVAEPSGLRTTRPCGR